MRAMERHSYIWQAATLYVSYMACVEHSLNKIYEDVYEGSSSAPAASSLRHVGSQNFSAQLVHTENTHSHIIKNDFSGSPSSQVCQKDPRLDRVPNTAPQCFVALRNENQRYTAASYIF